MLGYPLPTPGKRLDEDLSKPHVLHRQRFDG